MASTPRRRIDFESTIGWLLLVGVLTSVALIIAGEAWHRVVAGTFDLQDVLPATSVAGFVREDLRRAAALATGPRRLVNLGIAVLLLTPYLRVAASLAYFALVARDRTYTAVTAFVLAVLTYTLFA